MRAPRADGDPDCQDLVIGAGTVTQQRKGDPLFAQWYRNYTYADDEPRRHHSSVRGARRHRAVQRRRRVRQGHRVDPERLRPVPAQAAHQRAVRLQGRRQHARRQLLPLLVHAQGVPRDAGPDGAALDASARRGRSRTARSSNGTTYTTRLGYFVQSQFWKFRELSRRRSSFRPRQSLAPVAERLDRSWSAFGTSTPGRASRASIRKQNYGVERAIASARVSDFNTSPPPTYYHLPSQPEVLTQTEDDTHDEDISNRARLALSAGALCGRALVAGCDRVKNRAARATEPGLVDPAPSARDGGARAARRRPRPLQAGAGRRIDLGVRAATGRRIQERRLRSPTASIAISASPIRCRYRGTTAASRSRAASCATRSRSMQQYNPGQHGADRRVVHGARVLRNDDGRQLSATAFRSAIRSMAYHERRAADDRAGL